jgi:hypothetical protein
MPLRSVYILVFAAFAIGFLSFPGPLPAQDHAAAAAQTLRRMRAITVEDELGYTVPPDDIPLLTQVKHQLRDLFAQVLANSGPNADADAVKAKVVQQLRDVAVEVPSTWGSDEPPYGHILDIAVEQRDDLPDVIVFSPRLSIACGNDSPLYIFQKTEGQWRLLIAVEANGYHEVKGAMGELQFKLSPPNALGSWFLAYLHQSPWCTSNWNRIDYAVLRPGARPYSPNVVFQASHGYYEGTDYLPGLQVRTNGFRIDFEDSQLLDMDFTTRHHTLNYELADGRATRVPPIAHSPAGFLDEWAHSEWKQAAGWSQVRGREVRRWHKELGDVKSDWQLTFVQSCPGPGKWQLGLDSGQRKMFATVVRTGSGYALADIGAFRPPGCPGEQPPAAEPAPATD